MLSNFFKANKEQVKIRKNLASLSSSGTVLRKTKENKIEVNPKLINRHSICSNATKLLYKVLEFQVIPSSTAIHKYYFRRPETGIKQLITINAFTNPKKVCWESCWDLDSHNHPLSLTELDPLPQQEE